MAQVANPNILGNFQAGLQLRRGIDDRRAAAQQARSQEDRAQKIQGLIGTAFGQEGGLQLAQQAPLQGPTVAGQGGILDVAPTPRQSPQERDAALKQIFQQDPELGNKIFDSIGAFSERQRDDAARRAFEIRSTSPDRREDVIRQQAADLQSQGRDPKDTIELLDMTPEQQDESLRIVELASLSEKERTATGFKEEDIELKRDELEFKKQQATGKERQRIESQERKLLEDDVKSSKTKFDQASKIRSEVSKVSDEFNKIQGSFDRIQASDKSAAGDLALIFNFMKMLDPGSVVREGEFATAQNAAGVPERIRNTYQKLLTGERLSPKQRSAFEDQSKSIFDASSKRQESRLNDFEALGKRFGLERKDIVVTEATEETPTKRRSFNPQTGRLE